ncbi:OB-fold domain-containing protein [Kitasatospora sp. NPDC101235]|uniref:OB-fold domain-containing protein n=1 Tax=Kitasatospora sp. NPDC101235 TaxID=3364101 RepID=UPI0037FFB142
MPRLVAYGSYLPHFRLRRDAIRATLGTAPGRGTRTVASYDEDSTTMGVEAARSALAGLPDGREAVRQLLFATAAPTYLDKTNAAAIHAALGLGPDVLAVDLAGSVRSGAGALLLGARTPSDSLVVLSDVRVGLPGSEDEAEGGDGAAAFLFAQDDGLPALAEVLATASVTTEVLDRWRPAGATASCVWDERFTEQVYLPLAKSAVTEALHRAGLAADGIDHLIVAGLHRRAARSVAARLGAGAREVADDLTGAIGNAGAAQAGILLADVLDRAEPGRTIALVVIGDGVCVLVLRTGEALAAHRATRPAAPRTAGGDDSLAYADYLTWRGFLDRQPQLRPAPPAPAAPPSHRRADWKFGFTAGRCTGCGSRQLPPTRVCGTCRSVDSCVPERMDGVPATVVEYTVDRLAYSPHPPLILALVEFDGGGRLRCELTDVAEQDVRAGLRVSMTFRRMSTTDGISNYFWKAHPLR